MGSSKNIVTNWQVFSKKKKTNFIQIFLLFSFVVPYKYLIWYNCCTM